MKKRCILLFIVSQCYLSALHATQHSKLPMLEMSFSNKQGFITHRDLLGATTSGISIKNVSTSTYNLTWIYIQTLYSPQGPEGINYGAAVGALWSNVTLAPSATTNVGANFLYNMIMNYLYQNNLSTTSGDVFTPGNINGTPWLLFLGVVEGPTITTTYTISSTLGHGNDLVYIDQNPSTSYSQQICVTCNDASQTCVLQSGSVCYHTNGTSSAVQDIPCNLDGSTGCAAGIYPPA